MSERTARRYGIQPNSKYSLARDDASSRQNSPVLAQDHNSPRLRPASKVHQKSQSSNTFPPSPALPAQPSSSPRHQASTQSLIGETIVVDAAPVSYDVKTARRRSRSVSAQPAASPQPSTRVPTIQNVAPAHLATPTKVPTPIRPQRAAYRPSFIGSTQSHVSHHRALPSTIFTDADFEDAEEPEHTPQPNRIISPPIRHFYAQSARSPSIRGTPRMKNRTMSRSPLLSPMGVQAAQITRPASPVDDATAAPAATDDDASSIDDDWARDRRLSSLFSGLGLGIVGVPLAPSSPKTDDDSCDPASSASESNHYESADEGSEIVWDSEASYASNVTTPAEEIEAEFHPVQPLNIKSHKQDQSPQPKSPIIQQEGRDTTPTFTAARFVAHPRKQAPTTPTKPASFIIRDSSPQVPPLPKRASFQKSAKGQNQNTPQASPQPSMVRERQPLQAIQPNQVGQMKASTKIEEVASPRVRRRRSQPTISSPPPPLPTLCDEKPATPTVTKRLSKSKPSPIIVKALSPSAASRSPAKSWPPSPASIASPLVSRTWRSTLPLNEYTDLSERYGAAEMQRQEVIWELCETEESFVNGLRGVLRLFAQPLRTPEGNWIKGVPKDVASLFDWLDDIVYLHSLIAISLQEIQQTQKPIVTKISEAFLQFVPRLEVHQPYLLRFEAVTKQIEDMLVKNDSDFGEFVRMQQNLPECGNMKLSSFLLKPVQRLMKYPLFFKQIGEVTPYTHPDYVGCLSLLHSTDAFIRVMQEVKAKEEEHEKNATRKKKWVR